MFVLVSSQSLRVPSSGARCTAALHCCDEEQQLYEPPLQQDKPAEDVYNGSHVRHKNISCALCEA